MQRFLLILMVLMMCRVSLGENKVEWVAHRGESFLAPENTMPSYQLGWKLGDDANETDIHLTQDGQVVICHDADTKRTTNANLVIKDSTLDQLRALDAGSWKDPKFAGEKLPTLAEALASIPEGKRFFVEIKSGIDVVPEMVKVINSSGKKPQQIVLISFHADALAAAKKALPAYQTYFLSGFKQDKETKAWSPKIEELIKVAKDNGFEGLDLQAKPPFDPAAVKKIKEAGLGAYVWTVDDPAIAKNFIAWGIDGITTNRGAWLKEQVKQPATPASK
jgi:glycerophosphoryl diester phosphodiesterase